MQENNKALEETAAEVGDGEPTPLNFATNIVPPGQVIGGLVPAGAVHAFGEAAEAELLDQTRAGGSEQLTSSAAVQGEPNPLHFGYEGSKPYTVPTEEENALICSKLGLELSEGERIVLAGTEICLEQIGNQEESTIAHLGCALVDGEVTGEIIVEHPADFDNLCAFEAWQQLPGNENKTVEEWHASLIEAPLGADAVAPAEFDATQTMAFKMAQELGLEMQELTVTDPLAGQAFLDIKDHPLTKGVTRLFQYLGHPAPEAWLEGIDEGYISDPRLVQVLLNQWLHRQLNRLELHEGKQSIQVRQVLRADDRLSDWMVMLEVVAIPFMIDNDLPMPITGRDQKVPDEAKLRDEGGHVEGAVAAADNAVDTTSAVNQAEVDPAKLAMIKQGILLAQQLEKVELQNDALRTVNAFSMDLSEADRQAIIEEAKVNPEYFAAILLAGNEGKRVAELREALNEGRAFIDPSILKKDSDNQQ